MAERPVLPHAPDGGGERLGQQQVVGQLDAVLGELGDGGVLVAAVEVAQEVAAVLAVHGEEPGASAMVWATNRTRSSHGSRRVASQA